MRIADVYSIRSVDFYNKYRENKDFYGPFWINLTLVAAILIGSHAQNTLLDRKSSASLLF